MKDVKTIIFVIAVGWACLFGLSTLEASSSQSIGENTINSINHSLNLRIQCDQQNINAKNTRIGDIIYFQISPEILDMFNRNGIVTYKNKHYKINYSRWHIQEQRLTLIINATRPPPEPK